MNTKGLAKNYHTLTPMERVPLIHAASARGDDTERQRLVSTAPMARYRLSDHFVLTDTVNQMAIAKFID